MIVINRLIFAGLIVVASTGMTQAALISITGYDINGASISGTGNWLHDYTGTITPTVDHLADYSGGTGTLADGVIGNSIFNTQLFCSISDCGVSPLPPVGDITFFFDGFYTIDDIRIFGGDFGGNTIPGAITDVDVAFGGATASIETFAIGLPAGSGQLRNDLILLNGTGLEGLVTNQINLSNFRTQENSFIDRGRFSIAEVQIFGNPIAVPEPSVILLLCIGLASIGFAVRRRWKAA